MARMLVAAHFVWDEYPGLRVGRLYAGKDDIGTHPRGETHAVASPEAERTVCGLPRSDFPHEFAESVRLKESRPCQACGLDSPSVTTERKDGDSQS